MSRPGRVRRILVVGAGPQAKVAIDIFRATGEAEVVGVLDDDPAKLGSVVSGVPVIGAVAPTLERAGDDEAFFVAVGGNTPRVRIAAAIRAAGRSLACAVHPSAIVAGGARLGENVLVCAHAVIGVETEVCDDAVVNTGATVDHESHVGVGAYLAPGVRTAGRVRIGREAFVGIGSTLGPEVTIGDGSIVGADSLVLTDIPAGRVAWGRPAAVVREVTYPVDWSRLLSGRRRVE